MKARAKKYSKLLYFIQDPRMKKVVNTIAEKPSQKRVDRHYPYNCISKFFPMAHMFGHDVQATFQLPCGYLYGESWGALKKCWKGYKIAKKEHDEILMKEYATRIQKIQTELGVPTASFPNLGLMGDIFFLYDKDKETELRNNYAYENVVCDKFDVENVEQLVAEGKAKVFNSKLELKRYKEQLVYDNFNNVMNKWAESEATQEYLRASTRRWNYREKIKDELRSIKEELDSFQKDGHAWRKIKGKERESRLQRRRKLMQEKILKESELHSVNAVELVKTDDGWKYAKKVIIDDFRRAQLYNHDPTYYLTDLAGHRLANYKEEAQMQPLFDEKPGTYRVYLDDCEYNKIYKDDKYKSKW